MLSCRRVLAGVCALTALLLSGMVVAKEPTDQPVILVATPQLRDRLYSAKVLIATPLPNGQHIGFIINYPTQVKLSQMFPDHAPSRKVLEPVFFGGPVSRGALFALVQRPDAAGSRTIQVASNLFLEMEREKVDDVIEKEFDSARFFTGVVIWQPRELDTEIERGYWYVQDADTALVMRKSTAGMWEELVKRLRRSKDLITTSVR